MDTDPVLPEDEPENEDEATTLETVGTKEVNEADAVEQSQVVPDDEDYPHD
ncbi:hypothetical protein [Rhodococcus triatomae]